MSSHHIVREKQEPALLVLGMEQFTDELLGQLLEWSPTVLVTADTAEKLTTAGIKVDVVFGTDSKADTLQSDIKYIRASDDSYLQTALSYLVANNYPAVNIVTDSFLFDDYLAFADQINLVIYCADKKIYPVSSGFGKWKPAGELIYLMGPVDDLQTDGLQKSGANKYETIADGFFTLRFNQPILFIAENIA